MGCLKLSSICISGVNLFEYSMACQFGNVLAVIKNRKIPLDATGTKYSADVIQYTDYSPFGVELDMRHGTENTDNYRFGMCGMEKDDEVKGTGSSIDFGARMYDPRIGRFLSLDPLKQRFPGVSAYSYSMNSPIFLFDFGGKYPKVAIILENVYESDIDPAFLVHKKALEDAGYEVRFVSSAESAFKKIQELSVINGAIENLIIISHASPGGPNSGPNGFYTDSELRMWTKTQWISERQEELLDKLVSDQAAGIKIDESINVLDQAKEEAELFWGGTTEEDISNQKAEMEAYKISTSSVSMEDLEKAVVDKKLVFSDNATIVIAGCNAGGKHPYWNDKQEIFSTTLAKTLKLTVFSSEGYTGPGPKPKGMNSTTLRISNKNPWKDLLGHWIKTDSNGKRTQGSNTIDLANPAIK